MSLFLIYNYVCVHMGRIEYNLIYIQIQQY